MLKSRSSVLAQFYRSQLLARQFSIFSIVDRSLPSIPCANANIRSQSSKKSIALRLDPEIIDRKPVSWSNQFQRAKSLDEQITLLQTLQPIPSIERRMNTMELIKKNFELNIKVLTSIPTLLAHFDVVSVAKCDTVIRAAIAEILLIRISRVQQDLSVEDLRTSLQYTRRMGLFVSMVDALHGWTLTQVVRHVSDTTIPPAQIKLLLIDAFVAGIRPATGKVTSDLFNLIPDSEQLVSNLRSDNTELPFLRALSFGSIDFNHLNHESRMKLLQVAESVFSKESQHFNDDEQEAEAFVAAVRCLSFTHTRLAQYPEGAKCFDLIRANLPRILSSAPEKILPQFIEALYRIGFGLPEIFGAVARANPSAVYTANDILYKSFNAVSQVQARQEHLGKVHDKTPFTTFLLRQLATFVPLDNTEQDKIELCRTQPEEIAVFLHLTLLLLARESNVSFFNFEINDKKRVLLAAQRTYRHIDPNRFADLLWSLHYMKVTFEIMEKSRLADDFFLTIEKRAESFTTGGLHKLMKYLERAGFSWRSFDEKWEKSLFRAIISCINPTENVDSQLELLSGLSDLTFRWYQLPNKIRELVPWIGANTDQWSPRTHMSLVWALGRLRVSSRELDPALMQVIKEKMITYPMFTANGFLLVYTNLFYIDVSWSELPQAHMMTEFINIKDFTPPQIAQVISTLGKFHAKWSDLNDDFKQILVKRLQTNSARFTESDVASVMQAVSYLAFDSVHYIEQDQHLMTMIKTIVQHSRVKKAAEFKSFADRQHAQTFFEFLATFPSGQLMIAQLFGKRLEEKFVPVIDANPFADDGSARKKGLNNNIEVTLEIGNAIGTLLQGTGYAIRADIRPVRGIFGQELTIVSRTNKTQPLALISLHWTPPEDKDNLERLEQFRRYFYNFHYPNAKAFMYAAHGVSQQELLTDAEKLTVEILRAMDGHK